eukprot:TRINITY_DN5039_c0_g2_i1.p1 TRINITY_DN5039_c0_g2~~TRINITY_DN5039_c0_g2_i1.p1  ORF type:complete len:915 (+),score=193.00 TRINITY_DN5039_c0_g2_i1:331-3075(+)
MDERQHYDRFGVEDDYENGQWIGGEFYYSKQKEKRKQTADDNTYGIFNESDSDNEGGGKRKRKDGGLVGKADFTKPVNFVSKGNVVPTEELNKIERDGVGEEMSDRPGLGLGAESGEAEGRPGLGNHAGIGFGFTKGEAGKEETAAGAEEEGEDIWKTALGQMIKEKAEKKKEMEKEKERKEKEEKLQAKGKTASGGVGSFMGGSKKKGKGAGLGDIGEFEKHTKGFGLKMLEKMGYKGGGLGKNDQGIAIPVEAKMRPKMMGMGFNDFKERENGLPPPPGKETEEDKVVFKEEMSARAKQSQQQQSWKKKKGGDNRTSKKEYKTAAQLLEEKRGDGREATQTIIDMRGAQVRVLTSMEGINEEAAAPTDDTPMPELQHNLRLLVDMVEADIQVTDRKLTHERDTLLLLKTECERARGVAKKRHEELHGLEALVQALDNIQANVDKHGATLDMVCEAFKQLRSRFKQEIILYNIPAIALMYAVPIMTNELARWNPLASPTVGFEAMSTWKSILATEDGPTDYSIFSDLELAVSQDPFTQLVREVMLPAIRTTITNFWEPRNPEALLNFLELWEGVLPPAVVQHVLEHLVMPKLTSAVDSWDPLQEPIPIHAWVHPWLPLLGARLEPLYQPIRYKLGRVLGGFTVGDASVHAMLAPWKRVFDPMSFENLLVRFILPKLGVAMQSFVVDPRGQKLEIWHAVKMWAGTIPVHHMVALMEVSFFAQWHEILYKWLCSPGVDYDEVTFWYKGWKAEIPDELLASERVRTHLNVALDRMNAAIEGAELLPPGARESVAYLRAAEQLANFGVGTAAASGRANGGEGIREDEDGGGMNNLPSMEVDMNLKEEVEEFAQQNDVQFVPKPGRMHEGLQVYSFGAVSVCVDTAKMVLLAQKEGRWSPVSLEQLLELHRTRGGKWG